MTGKTRLHAAADVSSTIAEPRPYLKGRFLDCDATDSGTFRASTMIKTRDILELGRLFVVQGLAAWIVPPRRWAGVAKVFGSINTTFHPSRTRNNLAIISPFIESQDKVPAALEIEQSFFAGRLEERFQYLRSHRPGGWHPVVRIHGTEHVEKATAEGKGIIFWGGNVAFNDLVSKIAFHRMGLEVYHYTRPVHGLSNSRFGIKYINPVRTLIERRYLGARVCAEDNVAKAMEVLKDVVEAGGAASIKTGNRGRNTAVVPFLGGQLELATGPVVLAKRWNAVLLPTFSLRAPDGSFDVTIGAPLESKKQDLAAYCQDIVGQYAKQLEPIFLSDPGQWRGWRLMIPAGRAPEEARYQS